MEALAQANADVPAADSVVGEADGTVDSALVEAGNTNTGTNNVAAAAAPNESTQEDAVPSCRQVMRSKSPSGIDCLR